MSNVTRIYGGEDSEIVYIQNLLQFTLLEEFVPLVEAFTRKYPDVLREMVVSSPPVESAITDTLKTTYLVALINGWYEGSISAILKHLDGAAEAIPATEDNPDASYYREVAEKLNNRYLREKPPE